jgi:hypothetical protein
LCQIFLYFTRSDVFALPSLLSSPLIPLQSPSVFRQWLIGLSANVDSVVVSLLPLWLRHINLMQITSSEYHIRIGGLLALFRIHKELEIVDQRI